MENTALVLIDIQNIYFTEGPMLLHKPLAAARKAEKVLKWFRKENLPVIHVKHAFEMKEYDNCQQYVNEIHETVKPIKGEIVIEKHCPSGFLGTSLQRDLQKLQVKKLVVVGMMSHMCVDTTVRACQDYGYQVTLIEDAATTMDLNWNGKTIPATTVHKSFMAALNGAFANVITAKEFLSNNE